MRKNRYVTGYREGTKIFQGSGSSCIEAMSLKEAREACKNEPSETGCVFKLVKVAEKKPTLECATTRELLAELSYRYAPGEER